MPSLYTAFAAVCFPCNPVPFAKGLADHVLEHGTDSIQSDDAKRILWVLIAQAYGQLATVDLCSEWERLLTLPASQPNQQQEAA